MITRKIIRIDEDKCDGCGECVPACHEGAIKVINGKARLINESFCDGLGACLEGVSPLSIYKRDSMAETSSEAQHNPTMGLRNWPIQLMLAPTEAPYFDKAELVIAADCVAFAFASFDKDILSGKCLLIACPKLDKVDYYHGKMTEIFQCNTIMSVTIAFMEVPCCFGLVHLVTEALSRSGKEISMNKIKLGIQGDILENSIISPAPGRIR